MSKPAIDFGKGADGVHILKGNVVTVKDKAGQQAKWRIDRFNDPAGKIAEFLRKGGSIEEAIFLFNSYYLGCSEFEGNVCLNEGIWAFEDLLAGLATPTLWNNANARVGVGTSSTAEAATQVRLQAVQDKPAWAASTAYALGAFVRPTALDDAKRFVYECTTAGTSSTAEPVWPTTDGATVTDGTVTWTARESIFFKAMDAGYPSRSAQEVTWRGTYGGTEANKAWNEFTVDNGATAAINLNRKVSAQGTKVSGQTWVLSIKITWS